MTEAKKSILFVHKTFPAQFGGFAKYLVSKGWDVRYLTLDQDARKRDFAKQVPSVKIHIVEKPASEHQKGHRFLNRLDDSLHLAQKYQEAATKVIRAGFTPDIIMAHSGWGVASLLPSVWPSAALVPYLEWWYNFPARDVPQSQNLDRQIERRGYAATRNLMFLNDMQHANLVFCPTEFQAAEFPNWLRNMTHVLHDGINCDEFHAGQPEVFDPTRLGVPAEAPIVTYATRGMEPTRGFPNFMAAASQLQKLDEKVHILVAGNDSVQYGSAKNAVSFKEKCLNAHEFDLDRLHFVGMLPLQQYRDLLRVSDVHIYLSEPFVLSWSLVHAMSTECALVVSDNEMLREPLEGEALAMFVNDKAPNEIAAAVKHLLDTPKLRKAMGASARKCALAKYDEKKIHPEKEAILLALL